jgi:hypothetical protein
MPIRPGSKTKSHRGNRLMYVGPYNKANETKPNYESLSEELKQALVNSKNGICNLSQSQIDDLEPGSKSIFDEVMNHFKYGHTQSNVETDAGRTFGPSDETLQEFRMINLPKQSLKLEYRKFLCESNPKFCSVMGGRKRRKTRKSRKSTKRKRQTRRL